MLDEQSQTSLKSVSTNTDATYFTYNLFVREGLVEAQNENHLTLDEFKAELAPFLLSAQDTKEKLNVLEGQRELVEDDLDEIASAKRQKHDDGPSLALMERAYTESILPRVMAASGRQKKIRFDQSAFRKAVQEFYSVPLDEGYCHLLGAEIPSKSMKSAHIVPKSLTTGEISFLYGSTSSPTTREDPKNAVCLHQKVEEGLDNGTIVILPIYQIETEIGMPSRWKCVLANDELRREMVIGRASMNPMIVANFQGKEYLIWGDLDGRELCFRNDNRPAKRFLYFRFIITYIFHKRNGSTSFTAKIEHLENFWPTPGPYLRRSMLKTLARNISGCEIPPKLIQETTFEEDSYLISKAPGPHGGTLAALSDLHGAHGPLSGTLAAQDLAIHYEAMSASLRAGRSNMEEKRPVGSPGMKGESSEESDLPVFDDYDEML